MEYSYKRLKFEQLSNYLKIQPERIEDKFSENNSLICISLSIKDFNSFETYECQIRLV